MVNSIQCKKNGFSQSQLKRWENYRKGIEANSTVRNLELEVMYNLCNPNNGDHILEIGTGSGYLTIPILNSIGNNGYLISADVNEENLNSVQKKIIVKNFETFLFSTDISKKNKFEKLKQRKFNKIISLATFHHFDDKSQNSGSIGRFNFLTEAYNMLDKDGKLVIGDIISGTDTQKYFDAIDNPYYFAPNGHPHEFFDSKELEYILKNIGYKNVEIDILEVPWQFENKEHAKKFYHQIHNANCPSIESYKIAKKILGERNDNSKYSINWQLGFVRGFK